VNDLAGLVTTPRRSASQSAWRGVVTRVASGKPYVEIPRRTPGHEYGPCDIVEGLWTAAATTETVAVGDHGSHAHGFPTPLAKGNRVLVVFVGPDDPVVVGRLT
jgi:hypothetical protein